MKLITLSNPLVTLQSKIRAVSEVSFSQGSQLDLAQVEISTALSCGHFLHQSAVAEQAGVVFSCLGISKGGCIYLSWAGCPSLGAHREVWEPPCSAATLTYCLCPGLCPPEHPPSLLPKSWREFQQQRSGGFGSGSAFPTKSQELRSFQLYPIHIFSLSDIPR